MNRMLISAILAALFLLPTTPVVSGISAYDNNNALFPAEAITGALLSPFIPGFRSDDRPSKGYFYFLKNVLRTTNDFPLMDGLGGADAYSKEQQIRIAIRRYFEDKDFEELAQYFEYLFKEENIEDHVVALSALASQQAEETLDDIRRRLVAFYQTLMNIAKISGWLTDHLIIYPATGIDIIPSQFVKLMALNHGNLSEIGIELIRNYGLIPPTKDLFKENLRYESNARITAHSITSWIQHPDIGGITVLLKGSYEFLFPSQPDGYKTYLESIDAVLRPGDRIFILENKDDVQAKEHLRRLGYHSVPFLVNSPIAEIFYRALLQIRDSPNNVFMLYQRWYFGIPDTFKLYEKRSPHQLIDHHNQLLDAAS